jgi:RNA polymerase sigma-70 factor (ECF subfamily)
MNEESKILGGDPRWPSTCWTAILSTSERTDPRWARGWETLAELYWPPVYLHIRRKWGAGVEQAKDLAQDFFAWLLEDGAVGRADPDRGRFRAFLRACLENFLRDAHKSRSRVKRGGDVLTISLDALPDDPTPSEGDPFDPEWKRVILERSTERLQRAYRDDGKPDYWEAFDLYYVATPPKSYAEIARFLGVAETDVTNYLHHARETLRRIVQEVVRDTVDTESDLREELRALFGESWP